MIKIRDVYRPRQLGILVTRLCHERGLSAAAVSRLAGLSINQVRNVQRGLHRPSPGAIDAIVKVLCVDEGSAAQLRRLAGIDPDPAAAPEAKRARREAWPLLTYLLVNHVLLPRLELERTIARMDAKSPATAAHLRAAASGASLSEFCKRDPGKTAPPRPLLALIEKTFDQLTARDLPVSLFELETGQERNIAVCRLRGPARSSASALEAFVAAYAEVGWDFAIRLFPLVFHAACRCWPFEKVYMPYALHGRAVQRALYELVRTGTSVEDVDLTLIGLGTRIARGLPSRHRWGMGGTLSHPDIDEWPAPPGNPDFVFDHLDRGEFLDRFPLLKLDVEGSQRMARSMQLPSREALLAKFERTNQKARDALRAQDFFDGLVKEDVEIPWSASFIERHVAATLRKTVEKLIDSECWADIAAAGRAMKSAMDHSGIPVPCEMSDVVKLADSLARRDAPK